MVRFIEGEGFKLPVLFSQRTYLNFEKQSGIPITKLGDPYRTENVVILALEALRSGHKSEKMPFNMDQEELLDLDDKHGLIELILEAMNDDEKKPMPLTKENTTVAQ